MSRRRRWVIGAFVRGLSMRDVESLCERAGLGKLSKCLRSKLGEGDIGRGHEEGQLGQGLKPSARANRSVGDGRASGMLLVIEG
jgi:hypothetical protein